MKDNALGKQCEISLADIALSWHLRLVHWGQSECRCICRIGSSCHSELFLHFQMLNNLMQNKSV